MTLCHHPQTVCETPVVPDTIADTEENNEEVRSDDNVETTLEAATDDDGEKEASAGGCGDEVTTRDASEKTSSLTKPQWKISTSVKKSGQPKITQAARKKIYDPQETSDRYAKLQTYLKAKLVPLLPPLPSPMRYRFQQHTRVRQQDNYNCGLFVYCFWKRVLHVTFRQE
ncbi:hypothetical protein PC122_g10742 [Phytophthora cactorum]|nr:hypothetical protein PC122_g10742 [Phytophthora cactorum]